MPEVVEFGKEMKESRVRLECAVAAIGAERFRIKHGRWPESLQEVVAAKLLEAVPMDQYDGRLLRYRKTPDGVVVYSVGPFGKGTGDGIVPGRPVSQLDRLEFRLWDENARRQPPRPIVIPEVRT